MKKGKRTDSTPEFNLSDYDYLSSKTPLIGWIWEFARRSKEYQEYWAKYHELKTQIMSPSGSSDYLKLIEFADEHGPFNMYFLKHKDPSEAWDNNNNSSFLWACGLSKSTPVEIVNLKYGPMPYYNADPIEMLLPHIGKENILMALIDISAPRTVDELLSAIGKQISHWRKELNVKKVKAPKKQKKNRNKLIGDANIWKGCLIVYDIKQKHKKISYEDIANLFVSINSIEVKTIERYYNAANEMINGGYRKYL